MLREFLRKIFSPPQPIEEPRVQKEDFARLKQKVHVTEQPSVDETDECMANHGPLSLQHSQHTPLSRSVSLHASQSAYERYLQRNAAKADNWAAFDDILHPKIEPLGPDAKPASFLTPEEEEEIARRQQVVTLPKINPFLKYEPPPEPETPVTPAVVKSVEKIARHCLQGTSGAVKPWKFEPTQYGMTGSRKIDKKLEQRFCRGWLLKHASSLETRAEAQRELATSSLPEVRAAIASNERIPYDCLWSLAHDADANVRLRLAKNPNCTIELLETLNSDSNEPVSAEARRILKSITG